MNKKLIFTKYLSIKFEDGDYKYDDHIGCIRRAKGHCDVIYYYTGIDKLKQGTKGTVISHQPDNKVTMS